MENASYGEVYEFIVVTTDATPTNVTTDDFYVASDSAEALGPNGFRTLTLTVKAQGRDRTIAPANGPACYLERQATFKATGYTSSTNSLTALIDAVVTAVVYTGLDRFAVGDVIRLDDEEMLVTAVVTATNTLTVTRGYNGTTAASHSLGTPIYFAPAAAQVGATTAVATHQDPSLSTTAVGFNPSRVGTVAQIMPRVTGVAGTTIIWYVVVEVQVLRAGEN
jgi:hypothetical protein